jgi:hypothetical protein
MEKWRQSIPNNLAASVQYLEITPLSIKTTDFNISKKITRLFVAIQPF